MKMSQNEFDKQCAWFKKALVSLQKLDAKNHTPVDIMSLAGEHPAGGDDWAYKSFAESVVSYNESLARVAKLEEERKLSLFEQLLQVLGPCILVIALALRITKVTGEISLESAKNRSK